MQPALNIVEVSSPDAFNQILYPTQHAGTYQYLQNQFANISATITESGRKFFEEGKAIVEKFCDGTIDRAARATIRMAQNLINPNIIRPYFHIDDIQAAPPLMQRYIMAEPYLRAKFHAQLCSGYAGLYVDVEPGLIGDDHYDYRRVNNGMVRFEGNEDDENDEGQWVSRTTFEDLREGDRELSFDEKVDILSTQETARMFAECGLDPTCPWGSKIG